MKKEVLMKRNYYIWGAGLQGIRAEYLFRNEIEIKGFVDNYVEGVTGVKSQRILSPHEVLGNEENYYIIAVPDDAYFEIKKQLVEEGLSEFEDFVFWRCYNKKVVYLHGNCHMDVLKNMLVSSDAFNEKYGVYPLQLIYNIGIGDIDGIFQGVDIFISQDIRDENEFGLEFGVNSIKKRLKKECITIIVPNLFGMGKAFFPQHIYSKKKNIGRNRNGLFPYGDSIIDKMHEERVSKEAIHKELVEGNPFSEGMIKDNLKDVFSAYEEREKHWDIKIVDYIKNNYKEKQLFYDVGHPTNDLMREIVDRLLIRLGINDSVSLDTASPMNENETFVYPCVSKALGLKWFQKEIRIKSGASKCVNSMDWKEYIDEYIWWIFGE